MTRAVKPCGTRAAAERHRRHGEPLCEPCTEAERTYHRDVKRLAYAIPSFRARENARTAERMRRYRRDDPSFRDRVNAQRAARRELERERERLDRRHEVDVIVVDRLMAGARVPHNRPERLEAVRRLRVAGHGYGDIADRLHLDERQVHRDLLSLGLVAERCAS